MAKVALRVEIAASVEQVFAFVADYRNALQYMAHFQSFKPSSQQTLGLGARVRATGRLHGIPISTELEIVEFVRNKRLVSVSRRGIQSSSEWTFQDAGGQTEVTFLADYTVPNLPIAGRLLRPLIDEEIRRGARQTLENLKRILEHVQNGPSQRS